MNTYAHTWNYKRKDKVPTTYEYDYSFNFVA